MFNLKRGKAQTNQTNSYTRQNTSSSLYTSSSTGHHVQSEQKGGRGSGNWFRNTFSVGDLPKVTDTVTSDCDDQDDAGQNCDPLVFRLQQQKLYAEEKQQQNRSNINGRRTPRGINRERDPFDLGESFTSESKQSKSSNSEADLVDVVGWGSKSRRSSCNSNGTLSDEDDDEDSGGLMLDFGGVTPLEVKKRRSRTNIEGPASSPMYTTPTFGGRGSICSVNSQIPGLPLRPSYQAVDQTVEDSQPRMRRPSHDGRHNSGTSSKSSMSSVTDFTGGENYSHVSGGGEEEGGDGGEYYFPFPGDGDEDDDDDSPSHADLEQMLSHLEKESLSRPTSSDDMTGTQSKEFAISCTSTLSSPTDKARQLLSISAQLEPLPLPNAPHHDDEPLEQPAPQSQEEEDPGLAQLTGQTTEELKNELNKMQHQSRINLEQSWAEAEKMRVQYSELDEQLLGVKKELGAARAAMLTGAMGNDSSVGSCNSDSQNNHDFGGSQKILSKFYAPSQQPKFRRRRRTIDGAVDMGLGLGNGFRRSTSDVDLQTSALEGVSTGGEEAMGRSYNRHKRNDSASANDALIGRDSANHEVAQVARSSSDGKIKRRGSFLCELSKSFTRTRSDSQGSSSSDFYLGMGSDRSGSLSSLERECRDPVYNALRSASAPLLVPVVKSTLVEGATSKSSPLQNGSHANNPDDDVNEYLDDSTVSEARSGVFYPPPSDHEEKKDDSRSDSDRPLVKSASYGRRLSEMDDFDFDPFDDPQEHIDKTPQRKPKEKKGYARRPSFSSQTSFSSLFAFTCDKDDDDDDDDDDDGHGYEESTKSSTPPKDQEEDRAASINSLINETLILGKDNQIEQMSESIRMQEDEILACEAEVARETVKFGENENQLKQKESIVMAAVHALEQLDSDIESKLDNAEASEQNTGEKERALEEELVAINENLPETGKECEVDYLEKQLSCCRQQHNNSQENAIKLLSGLLDDFDAMRIPNLQEESEDNVSGDVVARFDCLTDKEEELVTILSDVGHQTSSSQASSTSSLHPVPQAKQTPTSQLLEKIFGDDTESFQLEELNRQISAATTILSERDSLLNKYTSGLDSWQTRAREEAEARMKLSDEIQRKIKQILDKSADQKRGGSKELLHAFPPSDYETTAFKELMARELSEYDDAPSDDEIKCIREAIKRKSDTPLDVLNALIVPIDMSNTEETRPSDEEGDDFYAVVREINESNSDICAPKSNEGGSGVATRKDYGGRGDDLVL